MRILLVNPGTELNPRFKTYAAFPNGILFIAAVLEKAGHQVQVYDNVVDSRKPADFAGFDPQLIGYSVLTGPDITQAIIQSQEFKKLYPEARIVWGNVHPSCTPDQTMAEDYIDYIVVGAAENAMLQLTSHLETGKPELKDIAGLVYRQSGLVQKNDRAPGLKNLDELPDPAWHLIDVKKYWLASLNTSRGCPFKCTFCYNTPFHAGYRGDFSAERIIAQIEHLQQTYGIKFIRFFEDNFTYNRKRLRQVCNLIIEKKIRLKWECESRADLSEEDIFLMARAGCISMGLGVESGSKRLLEFLKKGLDLEVMQQTFWSVVKARISPRIYIMGAVPSETMEDFEATRTLLRRMDNPPTFYMRFVPYPGTPIFDYCVENKLITPPKALAEWPDFSFHLASRGNLSQVPDEVVNQSFVDYARSYASVRVRFTWRHNKRFFLGMIKNPPEFFGALKELIKNSLPVLFNRNGNLGAVRPTDVRNRGVAGKLETKK